MEKFTVILIHKDYETKEAYVINFGIDKEWVDINIGDFDGLVFDMTTISYILRKSLNNYEFYRALDFSNNFNRDQSKINIAKKNAEAQAESEGFTITTHCDITDIEPPNLSDDVVREYTEILDLKQTLIMQTTKLKNECESLYYRKRKLEEEITQLNLECGAIKQEVTDRKMLIKSMQCIDIKGEKEKLDEIIARYKAGKKYVESLEKEALELNTKISSAKNELESIYKSKKEKEEVIRFCNEIKKAGVKASEVHSYVYNTALEKAKNIMVKK